ncbi:MAG: nucleotidyltransferase domain-containing protein [Promethearchaeota archaeon]
MKIIEGIEGDYIETKNDNLIFDVKGLLHPKDRKVCYLRFYPHPDGDRKKNGIYFHKVYNLNERYNFLREKYPKYLFFSKELDMEVQSVKKKDIKKIYTPRSFFKKLVDAKNLSLIEKYSKELCELLINEGNLSESSIGITGSVMVGLHTEDSDIDLIIYGTETCLKFQENMTPLFKKSNNIRKYNLDEYKSHYHWRVGGSNIPFETFLKIEQRKQHQGKFMDRDFFIRYIKSPKDWKGDFYDYQFKNYGHVKIKANILDSTDSIFTPCLYKINPIKILESNFNINRINEKNITEITSFRGRFCEQGKTGEDVLVEGKLEKVNYKNTSSYFRIVLTDPIYDKMIII